MDSIETLFSAAVKARMNAYAPYSGFAVGAALRTESGAIFSGANVENAAYPVGTCAESAAIAAMVLGGHRRIAEILIIGEGKALVTPCGACRQRLREFASDDAKIHVAGTIGVRATFTLGALLPAAFGPSIMKAGRTGDESSF
ncbi:MAG TPA: cytidine deaminase [Methylocella sp.]|nr:cytidine deaminase [Methylocella sp.]